MPTIDPMAACKQMSGEEMNRATRITPPVQGLSQPYTWPTPAGMACNSCKINSTRVTGAYVDNTETGRAGHCGAFLEGAMRWNGRMTMPSSVRTGEGKNWNK